MMTSAKIYGAETYNSVHLCANDYYCETETVVGEWLGQGAHLLGISGESIGRNDAHFERLRCREHPLTGERLTERTNEKFYRILDAQIAPPKSVSIVAVQYGDNRVRAAHDRIAREAFAVLEQYACCQGKPNSPQGGARAFSGNLVAAAFTHDASRALDPQLHTHFAIFNLTRNSAGQWKALENREMFRSGFELAGRYYMAEMAIELQRLGYAVEPTRNKSGSIKSFEIAGISTAQIEVHSTRGRQIEAEAEALLAQRGWKASAAERQLIATTTRREKLQQISTPEVRARQMGKDPADVQLRTDALISSAIRQSAATNGGVCLMEPDALKKECQMAVSHTAARNAVFRPSAIVCEILRENVGRVSFRQAVDQVLSDDSVCHARQAEAEKAPRLAVPSTTTTYLAMEREMIETATALQDGCAPLVSHDFAIQLNPTDARDQYEAVSAILRSRDGIIGLRGPAGTGKTTTLNELHRVLKESGVVTRYVAPTHKAKDVLRRDGFQDAMTLSQLLLEVKNGSGKLGDSLTVLDEAGMVSTSEMHALITAVKRSHGRLLLVGDEKQIGAVRAGDALAILRTSGSVRFTELTRIWRQRAAPQYLAAMELMKAGRVRDSLGVLDAQGRVHEHGPAYLAAAARSYCSKVVVGSNIAVVAPTWREIEELTAHIRDELKLSGQLTGPEAVRSCVTVCNHTPAQNRRLSSYELGTPVSTLKNRFGRLRRGSWATVVNIDEKAGTITVETDRKERQTVNVKKEGASLLLGRPTCVPVQAGDRLLFQETRRSRDIWNGDRGLVSRVEPSGEVFYRKMRNGVADSEERSLPSDYKGVAHAYATTAHGAQGDTVDEVIVAAERMPANLWNVATSRGRRLIEIFVPSKTHSLGTTPNEIRNRESAVEHFGAAATNRKSAGADRMERERRIGPNLQQNNPGIQHPNLSL